MHQPDLLVVGAGPVGATVARQAADAGLHVLLLDRRPHVAGNCHDDTHDGVLVHRYGPHYFRTDDDALLAYLSRFTSWRPGRYVVQAEVDGVGLVPVPVNRRTLELLHGVTLPDAPAAELLLSQVREPIADPQNAEEYALSRVGRRVYEALLLGYTRKQWGRHPRELAPWLLGRLPVRHGLDDRYVTARNQVMPADGYTALFRRMLDHPGIEVRLGVGYDELRGKVRPRVSTVYTGPVDEYFGCSLGPLPWRSLRFGWETVEREYALPCVQVNYPSEQLPYTRRVEAKHVTGQTCAHTVVCTEVPSATGEPYYPVPEASAAALARRYADLAEGERRERRVWFAGRLAEYRYVNMDEAFLRGRAVWEEIRSAAPPPSGAGAASRGGRTRRS